MVFWRSTFPRIRAARKQSERSKNFRSSRIAPAAAGILEAECFSIGRCCFQYGQGNIAEIEQAIFIVRNDAMNRNGVTAQRLVDEACRVARTCGRTATCSKRSFFRRGSPALWGCIGAGGIALAWLLSVLI